MTARDSTEKQLEGKTIVVTGANSGLGKETSVALAQMGAHVVMLCRNEERGNDALVEVRKRSGGRVDLILADLGDPDSVERWVERFRDQHDRLDVLVNNAGVYLDERRTNARGWELHWAVNHLGPALLTLRLVDLLQRSDDARIVNVSSMAHRLGSIDVSDPFYERRTYIPLRLYADTKLANIVWTGVLEEDLGSRGIRSFALHPGMIATNLTGDNAGPFALGARLTRPLLLNARQGSRTQVWLASAAQIPPSPGSYYAGSQPRTPSRSARNAKNIAALREWTLQQLEIEE